MSKLSQPDRNLVAGATMRFDGIVTPVVVPFDGDQEIDYVRLGDVIEFLIEKGVDQVMVGGTTGEHYALTPKERVEVARFARKAVKGRVPLIVGIGGTATRETLHYAEEAKALKADAILIASSAYALPTQGENAAHALKIDRAANLPVMLYNFPARTGADMGAEYLDIVSCSPNFQAIKESSGSIDRLHLLATGYPDIQVACGKDDQALEYYVWGCRSWVCAGSNFAPEAHRMLHESVVVEQDFPKARKIMAAMLPLMEYRRKCGKFVQCIKEGMAMRELPVGPPRHPLAPLDESEKAQLKAIVDLMNIKLAEIDGDSLPSGVRLA